MAISVLSIVLRLAAIGAVALAVFYAPIVRRATVLGLFRKSSDAPSERALGLVRISDTIQCEDLHYYTPANKLFTACEDSDRRRFDWFPPLSNFKELPEDGGSIHVINPETMKSTRLAFDGFSGPFVTHGIDVIADPKDSGSVYIFAVNHLPNPEYYDATAPHKAKDVPKARSQIELFHHVLKSKTAKHVRSIRHPMITTPNDIYAESPSSFYVTNDHFYREGLMRSIEDFLPTSTWSNIIHVQIDKLHSADAEAGIQATEALSGLHNNNGLGHGRTADEMLINSAVGGIFYRARPNSSDHTITILETILMDSALDNPFYYSDPYRSESDDASGYVLAGLARAIDLPRTFPDPEATDGAIVWYVKPKVRSEGDAPEWEKRVIFEDDGRHIRTATTGVLVPGPASPDGKKRAQLFVTGFVSGSIIAVPVEL